MRNPVPVSGTAAPGSGEPTPAGRDRAAAGRSPDDRGQAAVAPVPEPVSAAGDAAPASRAEAPAADTAQAARGRKLLSTAFVMVGPDGHLTVERHDGHVLVLRDVVMRPADYCGTRVTGATKARYCGGYAEVAVARPGGGPASRGSDPAGADAVAARRNPGE